MRNKVLDALRVMLRVDQAGELAAVRIYKGQAMALKKIGCCVDAVHKMEMQEQCHLDFFNNAMLRNKMKPTIVDPLWAIGSYCIGVFSASFGIKSAMLCTMAIEDVIDMHYNAQIKSLQSLIDSGHDDDELLELLSTIVKFREEEIEHRDIAKNHVTSLNCCQRFAYSVYSMAAKFGIAVSSKL